LWKGLRGLLILVLFFEGGNWFAHALQLPVPGSIIGMMLFFLLMVSGIISVHWVEEMAQYLLKHLSFFFLPITIGIMSMGDLLVSKGWKLLLILMISTFFGFIACGWTVQWFVRKKGRSMDGQTAQRYHS
jgi:holin-like protein